MRRLFLVAVVATLALAACSKHNASQERAARSDSAVVATSSSSTPIVVHAAGVRFNPPSTWPRRNYRVEAKSGPLAEAEQDGAAHDVTVHYQPDQPGHREASLCRIVVFPRHEWARVDSEDGPPVGTVIDSLHAWVYVAQMPQSNPYPSGSPDAEQFDAMRLSIRELRARFSIEGDGPDPNARDAGEL